MGRGRGSGGKKAKKGHAEIYTVTLNPAFDLHLEMENFEPYAENYAKSAIKQAGGKGVNLSRALKTFGVDNTAYIIAGRENAEGFVNELLAQGLELRVFYTPGRIRENITVHTPGRAETRVSLDNFSVSPEALNALEEEMLKVCCEGDIVVFNGRLPKGVDSSRALTFLAGLKERGACLAVDCNSFSAAELAGLRPWVIKPNEREAAALSGAELAPKEAAQRLGGLADNVILSLGGRGCVYAFDGRLLMAKAPKLSALSTVGAGDSMLAGFIKAFAAGESPEKCLAEAVAFGSAAVLRPGTLPPLPADVERLRAKIEVDRL